MFASLVLLQGESPAVEPEAIDRSEILYREALESYALGETETALSILIELETRLSPDSATGDLESLRRVQLGVIQDTLGTAGNLLLPVIVLHEHAYLTYLERDLLPQAHHSRATVFQLTELYAEQAHDSSAKRIASALCASLAGYFLEHSTGPIGFELYKRSLELEPSNEAALLGLAVAYEQQGRYRRALPYLKRLVAAHPESSEGRLRLAINLDRFERSSDASAHFRELIHQELPEWILALAYQESARMLHQQGRTDAARLLLKEGLERLPSDPILAIGLAYFNDLQGLGGQELDLAETLERYTGVTGPPPRYRYSRNPSESLDRVRRKLRAEAARGRPDLARILSTRLPTQAD